MKIAQFKGANQTPSMLLARAMEEAETGKIRACVLVVQDNDGNCQARWTHMKVCDLVFLERTLGMDIEDSMRGWEEAPQ